MNATAFYVVKYVAKKYDVRVTLCSVAPKPDDLRYD